MFRVIYDADAIEHLQGIDRKHHGLIREAVEVQLAYQADQPTRNRKLLRQPSPWGATWELRCGPNNRFRVYYRLEDDKEVRTLAIGVKDGNRLRFDGWEYPA